MQNDIFMNFNDYEMAVHIVQKAFRDRKDLAGEPYLDHLFYVADDWPNDNYYKIVALLHDLLEDCPEWTPEALTTFFTPDIVEAVVCLTKHPEDDYKDYIDRIKKFEKSGAKLGTVVVEVKLRDLEHNMQVHRLKTFNQKDIERLKRYHWAYNYLNS